MAWSFRFSPTGTGFGQSNERIFWAVFAVYTVGSPMALERRNTVSSNRQPATQCPDCQLPMTQGDHGATCPQCGWTVVYGNHGHWFVGWYREKADKVKLEQFWRAVLLPATSGGEAQL